jgi:hypothetical protein
MASVAARLSLFDDIQYQASKGDIRLTVLRKTITIWSSWLMNMTEAPMPSLAIIINVRPPFWLMPRTTRFRLRFSFLVESAWPWTEYSLTKMIKNTTPYKSIFIIIYLNIPIMEIVFIALQRHFQPRIANF